MNVNISGPVRVFALIGALAAAGLGVWFFLLGGLSPAPSASEPVKEIKPLYGGKPRAAVTTPAATPKSAPATAPAADPKPAPKPKAVPNPKGLPLPLARALAQHPVVVVSLYDAESKVDWISLGEARAGARRAGVGFVALNVLERRASEALMRKLGVLSAPAFFLYKRPGELVMRLDGFADRDLVAQAAVSVLPPALRRVLPAHARAPVRVTQARWSGRANAICREGSGISKSQLTTREQVVAAGPKLLAAFRRDLARLRALPRPTAAAARARTERLLRTWGALYALDVQLLEAIKAADAARARTIVERFGTRGRVANRLADDLGATTCTVVVAA